MPREKPLFRRRSTAPGLKGKGVKERINTESDTVKIGGLKKKGANQKGKRNKGKRGIVLKRSGEWKKSTGAFSQRENDPNTKRSNGKPKKRGKHEVAKGNRLKKKRGKKGG